MLIVITSQQDEKNESISNNKAVTVTICSKESKEIDFTIQAQVYKIKKCALPTKTVESPAVKEVQWKAIRSSTTQTQEIPETSETTSEL